LYFDPLGLKILPENGPPFFRAEPRTGEDTNLLGRDSPGHVYNPKRIRSMPVTSFAGSERPPLGVRVSPNTWNL
jgi:hypothetical protein